MGVCQSRSDDSQSQRQKSLPVVSEQALQEKSKSKVNGLLQKTMPSINCISCKSINVSKTKRRIQGEPLAKFYAVLNSQFVYKDNDNIGIVQHNVTGVVKVARNIQKPSEPDQDFDYFIANMQEQTFSSPHLANITELYQDPKSYYAVQEYCSGGLLSGLCGQIQEVEAIYIISQILNIIQEIHKQDNTHGNLSISSFALYDQTSNHYVKLIDIIPIFKVKEKSKISEMQQNDRKTVGLILFQLMTNKAITPQTAQTIIKSPKDLPTKTLWCQLVLMLLESRSYIVYEQVFLNQKYKEIVQMQEAKYIETIINKSVKKNIIYSTKNLNYYEFYFFQGKIIVIRGNLHEK